MDPLAQMQAAGLVAEPVEQSQPWAMALWHVFANLTQAIETRIDAGQIAIINAEIDGILPWFKIALAISLMLMAINWTFGKGHLNEFMPWFIRTAVCTTILGSATAYMQWVGQPITQLPIDLTNMITSSVGGTPFSGADAFDRALASCWKACLAAYEHAPHVSLKGIFIFFLIAVFWLVTLLSVGVAYMTWIVSLITLKMLVFLGPLAICCAAFNSTRRIFDNYVGSVFAAALCQACVVLVLTAIGFAESQTSDQINLQYASGNGGENVATEIQGLAILSLISFFSAAFVRQLPWICAGLCHGVAASTAPFSAAVSAAGHYGSAAASGAVGAYNMGARGAHALSQASMANQQSGGSRLPPMNFSNVGRPAGRSLSDG